MENNKLLIGVQFTHLDEHGKLKHRNIEIYVLRDITLFQLLEGIKYGINKLANQDTKDSEIYQMCRDIYAFCLEKTEIDESGCSFYKYITYTSYNFTVAWREIPESERATFRVDDLGKPICDLGFITSTRIIFDYTGEFIPKGKLDTSNVIEAFNPRQSEKIFFPEYNISSRQLYEFDTAPVEIIAPTNPPKKTDHGLLYLLLPSLISMGILLIMRVALMSGNMGSGLSMVILSAAMSITAIITTIINYRRQKKEYEQSLQDWRNQYQDYIDSVIRAIRKRQDADAKKLDELYPDMLTLIRPDKKGIYSINDNLYSRSAGDHDFLTFRIGTSKEVESLFSIKGEDKNVVFSEASFDLVEDISGYDRLRIFLRGEDMRNNADRDNLCKLPAVLSQKYRCLTRAPLLYSLKNKGALGLVDRNIDGEAALSDFFISRMIFELCYYHSPEDLQFVIFFQSRNDWDEIENTINRYKFLPHFRGLFSDKSQFVFDYDSANLVLSSLLTLISSRRAGAGENAQVHLPHIVFIVYEEHGLKEHAFAEYLPKAPESGEPFVNDIGLTFVFAVKYKEYLPAYCDDIVDFSGAKRITPRKNIMQAKHFDFQESDGSSIDKQFYMEFTQNVTRAMRFFSSIYYAHIAQNGKVPSMVSLFDLFAGSKANIDGWIRSNWGMDGSRTHSDITKSISVPIGKTETGYAYLDLHEKADGPHMLVAGTTGSGKTETLITYLLGLCAKYRPDELNLLLVDMKGGGFTKRLGHLPHVVGAVTDVDGDENGTGAEYMLGRFLNAMKAEIKRRKLLFNKLYVDNIDAYIEACQDIESHIEKKKLDGALADEIIRTAKENPLTHLMLVVDEFTELKRFSTENNEIDFIGEITTIARVGRSLGFHIILISQNIEGAITDDIRVNSRARLCLKVATRQASKDMIGTELAASPYMPGNGRAYLLVGTGSKFEYFQSGYSGVGTEEEVPVEMTLASKQGAYADFYRSDKDNLNQIKRKQEKKKQGMIKSQLDAFVEAICAEYEINKGVMGKPHMVFRAPLPTHIVLGENDAVICLNRK